MLDLLTEEHAYIYGLLLADGTLYLNSRNRGAVSIELAERDKDILYKIEQIIPGGSIHFRDRVTNFTNGEFNRFYCWSNHHIEFRHELIEYGFPIEDKSLECDVPNIPYNEIGFWRGYIDGNGSVGINADGTPLISLTIKSEKLKNSYLEFLLNNFGIKKIQSRNKRDNIYNICVNKEDAQLVSDFLYGSGNIYVMRKYNMYLEVMRWVRPASMERRPWRNCHV
jgi:hypothetical protein